MILALTLAGILTTQPVEKVYLAPTWFAYSIGNVEHDCPIEPNSASVSGTQATVSAQVCTLGLFTNGFEVKP